MLLVMVTAARTKTIEKAITTDRELESSLASILVTVGKRVLVIWPAAVLGIEPDVGPDMVYNLERVREHSLLSSLSTKYIYIYISICVYDRERRRCVCLLSVDRGWSSLVRK